MSLTRPTRKITRETKEQEWSMSEVFNKTNKETNNKYYGMRGQKFSIMVEVTPNKMINYEKDQCRRR